MTNFGDVAGPRWVGGVRAMTLRLPDEVHEALRREAFESRRSMNEVVLEALDEYWWRVLNQALREGSK